MFNYQFYHERPSKINPKQGTGISARETASIMGVSTSTVYRMRRNGFFGGNYRATSQAGGRVQLWFPRDLAYQYRDRRKLLKQWKTQQWYKDTVKRNRG